MTIRTLLSLQTAATDDLGGIETRIAFGAPAAARLDPFLTLAHHGPQALPPGNTGLPFDDHPHRGFETVTFVLDGALVHQDSTGKRQQVGSGGVQWMTAGRGIIHKEQVPADVMRDGGPLEILQLWLNLPAALKGVEPRYVGADAAAIPTVAIDAGRASVHLVSGQWGGVAGPVASLTGVLLSWIDLERGAHVTLPAPADRTVLCYVIGGAVTCAGRTAPAGSILVFDTDGDVIDLQAADGATILFGHAAPVREPVAWRGPFVMNSEAEVDAAFRDYRAGAFARPMATETKQGESAA